MQIVFGDLWEFKADARCITTNCETKSGNKAVMGRGIAQQARDLFPGIDYRLAQFVSDYYDEVGIVWDKPIIVAFPTKWRWREPSPLELVKKSAAQLAHLTDEYEWKRVVLPRPGVGNGGLKWELVRGVLAELLDDRFFVISPKGVT